MMTTTELTITEVLAAPVARVWAAWTEAAQLARWFGPPGMRVPEAEADVRPGGRYRIVMLRDEDGLRLVVSGEYRELMAPERLRFSWQWQQSPVVTEVDVRLRALDAQRTEMTLVHSQFADDEACAQHLAGWRGALPKLLAFVQPQSQELPA